MTKLIVVVDPDYGDRIERLAAAAPVWIVDTPTNRTPCELLWKSHPHRDHRESGALTLYRTSSAEDRVRSLLGVFPQLETHHGEVIGNEVVFPSGFVVDVIGLVPNERVTKELRMLGFTSVTEIPEGFRAEKC